MTKGKLLALKPFAGAYLITYAGLWLLGKLDLISGEIYLGTLFSITLVFAWMGCFRFLLGVAWCRGIPVRIAATTFGAITLSWFVCFITMFDPMGWRPSPIPLSDASLTALELASLICIGIGGLVLIWLPKKRHSQTGPA